MSDPSAIDYQPLQVIQAVWKAAVRRTIIIWSAALVAGFLLTAFVVSIGLAIDLGLGIVILYIVVLSTKVNKAKNAVWESFASANSWPLDTETPLSVVVPPSLQFGHSQAFSPVIQAQLGELICDILTYRCVTGYGRSQQTHNFTIATLALPKALPHLLLMSKKARADVQRDLINGETLKLEGDFNDYFSLQIEKGQEIDILTIITPDIMQTLVDYNQAEDIEILGNNLYFITNKDKRDYTDMQALIRSVVELGQQIIQNIAQVT